MGKNILRQARYTLLGLTAVCGSLLGTSAVSAGTDTANVAVSATVSANCTITSSGLAFGSYDPVSTNAESDLDATGTVSVTCTNGSAADITLGQGASADTGSTDAVPLRRMSDGGTNYLSYYLYQDSGRTTVWGNTTETDVAHTGTGTSTDITIYGRVTSGQNVPAAAYTDTVVATVTF